VIQGLPYDHKIDVWSFGIYAYELAMGEPPFMKQTGQEEINCAILDSPIPPIQSKYSSEFKSFIDCCLQKDPKERWTTKDLLNHKFLLNA
jgi:serine/threonine protein kinase